MADLTPVERDSVVATHGKPGPLPPDIYLQMWRFWRRACPELEAIAAECEDAPMPRRPRGDMEAHEVRDFALRRPLSDVERAIKAGPPLTAQFFARARVGGHLVRTAAEDKNCHRSVNSVVCCVVRRSAPGAGGREVVTRVPVFGRVLSIFEHESYTHADGTRAVFVHAQWLSDRGITASSGLRVVQFDRADQYLREHSVYPLSACLPGRVTLLPVTGPRRAVGDWLDSLDDPDIKFWAVPFSPGACGRSELAFLPDVSDKRRA